MIKKILRPKILIVLVTLLIAFSLTSILVLATPSIDSSTVKGSQFQPQAFTVMTVTIVSLYEESFQAGYSYRDDTLKMLEVWAINNTGRTLNITIASSEIPGSEQSVTIRGGEELTHNIQPLGFFLSEELEPPSFRFSVRPQ